MRDKTTRSVPALGSVVWHRVAGLAEDIEVAIQYVDAKKARAWGLRALRIQIEERIRVADLRSGRTKESHPFLFERKFETPEGVGDVLQLALEVLDGCVTAIRGADIEVKRFLSALELHQMIGLMEAALAQQRLPPEFRASIAGPGDLEAGGVA